MNTANLKQKGTIRVDTYRNFRSSRKYHADDACRDPMKPFSEFSPVISVIPAIFAHEIDHNLG